MGLHVRRQGRDGRRLGMEALERRRLLAGVPELIKDIKTSSTIVSSNPTNITSVGNFAFFTANDGVSGIELWRSDGTAAGTTLVKNIKPGPGGSNPASLVNAGGILYFVADDGVHGRELWKSDGTTNGTTLALDFTPGSAGSESSIIGLTYVNDRLYFISGGSTALWRTDGTSAGTEKLVSGLATISQLTAVGNTLYFAATQGGDSELWKSEGTIASTMRVADVNTAGSSSPNYLVNVGGILFFTANTPTSGRELYKSNGTALGTSLVKDINSGVNGSVGIYPNLTNVGGILYFFADDGANGSELWKSDGSVSGTVMVKDLRPGSSGSASGLSDITAVGATAYVVVDQDAEGFHLWKSNGTAAGTIPLTTPTTVSTTARPQQLTNANGKLFFVAAASGGPEIWTTDGTLAGTLRVKDIFGDDGARPAPLHLANAGGTLLFNFTDGQAGYELWKSNGTEAGTVLVKDIATANAGSAAGNLVAMNGVVYFAAAEQSTSELWRTDGTEAGTRRVRAGVGGAGVPVSGEIIRVGNKLVFQGGTRLWQSDGTDAGTTIVEQSFIGFREWEVVGTKLFFIRTGARTDELWCYDSLARVTKLVKDVDAPPSSSWSARALTNVNGTLMFAANGGSGGMDLWKSDGTAAGTVVVKRLPHLGNVPGLEYMTNVNGTLFFVGEDTMLWKSDATEAGTTFVKNVTNSTGHGRVSALSAVGNNVYFSANDGSGYELWKSDGTAPGTLLVKDVIPGVVSSFPKNITAVGNKLFFTTNDGASGFELWISDGTAAGTNQLSSFSAFNPSLRNFTVERGILYFSANETPGLNLWASDGTIAGTRPVRSGFELNLEASGIQFLGSTAYFAGFSAPYGSEIWKLQLDPIAGDYDSNGVVDGADFLRWQRSFGATVTPAGGGADGDSNGTVGAGDLGVWKVNYGSGAQDVPAAAIAAAIESVVANDSFAITRPLTDELTFAEPAPPEAIRDLEAAFNAYDADEAAALAGPLAHRSDFSIGNAERSTRDFHRQTRGAASQTPRLPQRLPDGDRLTRPRAYEPTPPIGSAMLDESRVPDAEALEQLLSAEPELHSWHSRRTSARVRELRGAIHCEPDRRRLE